MKKIFFFLIIGLFWIFVSGCSSIQAKRQGTESLASMKSAYIVVAPNGNPNIGEYIEAALARHNLKVDSGPLKDKPQDVNFYVTYKEHWNWDVVVYLDTLEVEFIDNVTGNIIGSSSFKNNKILESWPDPRTKTFEVVESIFNAK